MLAAVDLQVMRQRQKQFCTHGDAGWLDPQRSCQAMHYDGLHSHDAKLTKRFSQSLLSGAKF
jgi:hypothetical protein